MKMPMNQNRTQNPVRLEGETAIITGGGTGLGLAMARCLIASGSKVVIAGRREAELQKAVKALGFLIKRGLSTNWSRKLTMLVCAIAVIPVVFTVFTTNLWAATFLIGLAAAAHQGWVANLFTLVSDLFPKQAVASVVGFSAMCGSIAAMGFWQVVGYILQAAGSYWALFIIAASAYLVALGIMQMLIPKMAPIQAGQILT